MAWKKVKFFFKRQKITKPEFQKCSPNSVLKVEPKQNQFWNSNSMKFKIEAVQSWEKNIGHKNNSIFSNCVLEKCNFIYDQYFFKTL